MVDFQYIEIVLILLKFNELGTQQNPKPLGSIWVVQVNLIEVMQ